MTSIVYTARVTEYSPGKYLPDLTVTLGYDGKDENRTFAWGTEINIEARLVEEDGVYVMKPGATRVTHSSGAFDFDGIERHIRLLMLARSIILSLESKVGKSLHGVGEPLSPQAAIEYVMEFEGAAWAGGSIAKSALTEERF